MTGISLAAAVAVAGGAGAALRYLIDTLVPSRSRFPWALLLINTSGSFALGLLGALTTDPTWLAVVGTGLLGGYTTLSAASLDAALRWVDGDRADGIASALVMVLVCLAAASLGVAVGR